MYYRCSMAMDFLIKGHVQGVFFRRRSKDKADELGLTGFVENRPDGSVFIHAEGSDTSLKELEEWCHHGPPNAKVESVKMEKAEELGISSFEMRDKLL